MTLSSGSSIGTYEIVELLGSGGMAELYRGRDSRLKRDLAIKVLRSEFAADSAWRDFGAKRRSSHP